MRTTLTLDEDVAQQIRRLMRERDAGFKETVNELIRRGLRSEYTADPYVSPTFRSGVRDAIDLDHALRLVGELEDAEFLRKSEMGK